jgi:hypothetical protein
LLQQFDIFFSGGWSMKIPRAILSIALAVFLFGLSASVQAGSLMDYTYILGGNDNPFPNNGIENNGDFQDIVASISGPITVESLDGVFGPMPTPNESCMPFYDCRSYDGSKKNIAYLETSTGGWTGSSVGLGIPQSQLEDYTANGDGQGVPFSFLSSGSVTVTILATVTSLASSNVFGYETWPNPTGPPIMVFLGSTPGTYTFTPNGRFTFFFGQLSSLSRTDDVGVEPQFALFKELGSTSTPEPSTTTFTGFGMLAFGILIRVYHRNRNKSRASA